MDAKLKGIIIPAVTPFNHRQEFDPDMFGANIEKWNTTGVRGYMVLGSNGEFRSLDDSEAMDVVRIISRARAKDKTLIVGVGQDSLRRAQIFIDKLMELDVNIDYLSVLTPNYFGKLMNDNALYDYYTAVADLSPVPVLIYCAPSFANGVCVSVGLLKRLAEHPNIYGIKDTSTNMMSDYMLAAGRHKSFKVMAGSINTLMTCLALGGEGGVVSAANYLPEPCAKLVELYEKAGLQGAWDYYLRLQDVVKATGAKGGVAGVKACMNLLGFQAGVPRLPVMPLSMDNEEKARELLEGVMN